MPTATAPIAGPLVTFNHTYNKVNQRIGQTVDDSTWLSYPAGTPSTSAYTANALNQYTAVGAVTPTYDGNGNLTADGTYALGYDLENRLTSASGAGNTASYAFDARGWRKARTVNGTTTISVTDADNREVLECDGSTGTLQRWYAYGLGPNAVLNQMNVAGATRAALLPGQLGSIIASFDSGTGALTKFGYQPYGNSAAAATPFGYTGQRFDQESGLYYYRARHYSAKWGRFLQPDPIGYAGGTSLYAYAGNDPLNAIDPTGLASDYYGGNGSGWGGGWDWGGGSGSTSSPAFAPSTPTYDPGPSPIIPVGGPGPVAVPMPPPAGGGEGGGGFTPVADPNGGKPKDPHDIMRQQFPPGLGGGGSGGGGGGVPAPTVQPPLPQFPSNPAQSPGPGYEWRGRPGTSPGSPQGNWYNPSTGETLRPDLTHRQPIGPHWDYRAPGGDWYRWFPNGDLLLKP